ncbi:hypothetical protein O7599_25900 [Streptomyces sp. WMMC500]|uniref:hypothetical protein n=1 Tax=Streptomyces sp. WMMC500 TaxID=3015154 RepID=UPI00248CD932|nr:hypothetical protein [Streptomyces sp. WMMC500]WBB59018.1 hypothetical protein O7599_25900 [Streptomyces sp. WMMC500]
MTRDWLVCASCAGPVSEGRCSVCRASRERMRQENGWRGVTPTTVWILLALLAAVAAVLFLQQRTA